METLRNHTLVYDSDCPMCDLYTKGFINTGMLDTNGRVQYGCARALSAGRQMPVSFNNERARDQIALVDYDNGTVIYGIDSLIRIIGHSFPWVGNILNLRLVKVPLSIFYSFISYNRKVIAPPKVFEKRGACTPAYHTGYRIAYIIVAWLLTSLILANYTPTLYPIVPVSSFYREFVICAGQIIFQMVIVLTMTRVKILHYIGSMITVSLIGALLLLPMMIVTSEITVSPIVSLLWFGVVVTFMLLIHCRRVKMLGISPFATVSWVGYRLIVLWIILG